MHNTSVRKFGLHTSDALMSINFTLSVAKSLRYFYKSKAVKFLGGEPQDWFTTAGSYVVWAFRGHIYSVDLDRTPYCPPQKVYPYSKLSPPRLYLNTLGILAAWPCGDDRKIIVIDLSNQQTLWEKSIQQSAYPYLVGQNSVYLADLEPATLIAYAIGSGAI
ncbi:hypothetical protein FQN50_000020 [Emmonsiellopsis sp. PD_5]|nr:hypothetical protein FQN50_000020 [Emmonsiellopsis sp. PD_5]